MSACVCWGACVQVLEYARVPVCAMVSKCNERKQKGFR